MATSRRPGDVLAAPAHLAGLTGAVGTLGLHAGGVLGPGWWLAAGAVYGLGLLAATRRPPRGTPEPPAVDPGPAPREALRDAADALAERRRDLVRARVGSGAHRMPPAATTQLHAVDETVRALLGVPDDEADPPHLRLAEARFAVEDADEALNRWLAVRPGAAGDADGELAAQLRVVVERLAGLLHLADEAGRRAQQGHGRYLRNAPPGIGGPDEAREPPPPDR